MEYTLKTNTGLKCSACGGKEFQEKHVNKDGKECWKYVCESCSHVMKFQEQLKKK